MSSSSTSTATRRAVLEIVSDVVCPWCYIAKHRLEQALALAGDTLDIEVRWRPYELNRGLPLEGMDRRAYCEAKFGSLDYADKIYARVAANAVADGLPFDYRRIARTPNTRAAHRLIELSGEHGCQIAVVDALFAAYFVLGRDVGAPATLLEIAQNCGLDPALVQHAQDDPAADAAIAQAEDAAHDLGVDGVPAFVFNGRLLFSGAQSPETIAAALRRAVARGL